MKAPIPTIKQLHLRSLRSVWGPRRPEDLVHPEPDTLNPKPQTLGLRVLAILHREGPDASGWNAGVISEHLELEAPLRALL